MSDIVFLAHRLPYPPDKGDKIRSFHLLRYLAANHRVHLGCFVDTPADLEFVAELEKFCASVKVCRLKPLLARLRSTRALLTGQALSVPYYYDRSLRRWLDKILSEHDIESIVAYSSPMGQYILGSEFDDYRRTMDFVDVDSDKWAQYSEKSRWPMSWVYKREARTLAKFERKVAAQFDASVFVTENEVSLFNSIAPASVSKHHSVTNGVALDYFDPGTDYPDPFSKTVKPLVFTGLMNYWANVDAVSWFAKDVFPGVRKTEPQAEFWIVGGSPTRDVLALQSIEGVKVTGRVPDVRPYLRHAALVVAPLRIARGVQNKILEALAMGKPTLCSLQAASGLEGASAAPLRAAANANDLRDLAKKMLAAPASDEASKAARSYVLGHYDWREKVRHFEKIVLGEPAQTAKPALSE